MSPSLSSCDKLAAVNPAREEKNSSSVEEEAHTAVDDSLCSNSAPSLLDEKGERVRVMIPQGPRLLAALTLTDTPLPPQQTPSTR